MRRHRQLESAQRRAERALSLAYEGRIALELAIERVLDRLELLRSGCVDVDLEPALLSSELRLLYLMRELERFERQVTQPAEELRHDTLEQMRSFEQSLAKHHGPALGVRRDGTIDLRTEDRSRCPQAAET